MHKLLATFLCLSTAGLAGAADLSVQVSGIKNAEGRVMVAVYGSTADFLKSPLMAVTAAADPAGTTVVLRDLPAGDYALAVYHDANGNGKMDKNMMGIPTEDYGFSNNAMGKFGPPAFDSAKITLAAAGGATAISLK
jgi:uncharacterized protein (DUF2141 family)